MTSIKTPMKTVRGLGSAHHGTHHWWLQRLTAIALIPLSLWFLYTLMNVVLTGHEAIVQWLASSLNAIALAVLMLAMFWHAKLGVQVIVEDYVHATARKIFLLVTNSFVFSLMAVVSLFAIAKLHFLDVLSLGV